MSSNWALVHTLLVAVATVTSILTFALAIAYTAKLQSHFEWYDPAAAELIAASFILLLSLPVLHFLFHLRKSTHVIASVLVELVLVFVLWCLFLGGAAALSSGGWGWGWWRWTSTISGTGKATQAFAWLTWVDLTFLLAFLITFAIFGHRNNGSQTWTQPVAYDTTTTGTRREAMTTEAKNAPVGGNMGTAAATTAPMTV
ncbi:proteophosphoglycan ppg4 [Rhodotorula toruloides]|uniref:Proteophosphoglycan ppg4 n=1 Tax=Rhodotorula toruloides TaxID=5286 RepID=A0A511KHB2_RHOTO|nr:proteophosphoglycan ppg4 [Rhodotorula toruloides]